MRRLEQAEADQAVRDHAYSTYAQQKGWVRPFEYGAEEEETYQAEIGSERLAGMSLLEIGFGSGSLLAWARDRGAIVAGSEISSVAIERALEAGIEIIPADLEKAATAHASRFDLIVAFDVFEHLEISGIMASLSACATMLKPGGRLILRFPNAQSPFGLVPQHADITHITALSPAKIAQILPGTGLGLVCGKAAHRVLGTSPVKRVARRFRYAIQVLLDRFFRFVYPSPDPVTLAPVVVAILERRKLDR